MQELRVLLVEDNEADARLVREYLNFSDEMLCEIHIARCLSDALSLLEVDSFDLVLADLGLPDSSGLATTASLLAVLRSTPLIVLTGAADRALAEHAIQAGAQDYLSKDELNTGLLVRSIAYAIERERVQVAIRDSEQRFRAIFEHSPLAIVIAKPGGKGLIATNQAYVELLGYSPDEIGELTIAEVTHPDDLARDLAGIRDVTEGRSPQFSREKRLIRKDGQIIWVNASATVLRSKAGIPEQILVVQQDITAEKTAALKLEAERQRLKSVMETMPAFLYLQAPDCTIPFYNSRFVETFGDPRGRTCYQIFHGADSECSMCRTLHVLETRDELVREWTDDRGRVFELHESPFQSSDGAELVLVVGTEITELVAATQALRASEQRFRELADMLPEVLFEATLDGQLTYANQVAFARFGYSQHQLEDGLSVLDMLIPEHRTQAQASIQRLIEGKERRGSQYIAQRSDGTHFPTIIHASVVRKDGHPVGVRGILIDISDQVEAERAIRESERRHRLLFESAPVGIGYHSLEGKTLAINSTAVSRLKGTRDDYLGKDIAQYYRDPEEVRRRFAAAIASGEGKTYEDQVQRQGEIFWYQRTYTPIQDESGSPIGVQVISSDITAMKEAQQALEMAEHIVRLSPVGMLIYRYEEPGRLILIDGNQEAEALTDLSIEACLGKEYTEIWPAAEEEGILEDYLEAYRTNTPYSADDVYYQDERWSGHYRVRAFRIPGNRFVSSFEDITQQKKAENQLRASETMQRSILRASPVGIGLVDDGIFKWVSNRICKMTGYSTEELIGQSPSITAPSEAEYRRIQQDMVDELREHGVAHTETQWKRKDGSLFDVDLRFASLDPANAQSGGIFSVLDITQRKFSEAALRQSEESYRTIFNSSNDGIVIHDAVTGQLLDCNEKVLEMFGYTRDEFLTLDVGKISSEESRFTQQEALKLIHAAAHGTPQVFEWHCKRKSGELFWMEVSLRQVTILGKSVVQAMDRDISERKRLEAQLRQSQKLESIGTLASGVAHEINNPLMGMINYAELISSRTADDSLRQFAEGIKAEGDRVAKIVRNLLSFSRQEQEPKGPARMHDIVNASLTLIGSLLRKSQIQVEIDVSDELPLLRCRSQQIQQVVINLLTNARDSLKMKFSEGEEGQILRIRAQCIARDGAAWLRTTVEDNGVGLSPALAERVFDPFFTTKSRDEGTGLGLSISYGIIRDHGGSLTVESEPETLTQFHIDLPLPEDLN